MTQPYRSIRLLLEHADDRLHVRADGPGGASANGSTRWEAGSIGYSQSEFLRERAGARLGAALFPAAVGALVSAVLDDPAQPALKLYLSAQERELLEQPWEFASISVGGGPALPLGLQERVVLARFVHAERTLGASGGRVLIATSLRGGQLRLPDGSVLAAGDAADGDEVERLLASSPDYDPVRLGEPLTEKRLAAGLDELTYGFYFGGHHVDEEGRRGLVVAAPVTEESATAVLLPAERIARLLADARVQVAVFAACNGAGSADGAAGAGWKSLAHVVAGHGIRYVVAMQGRVEHSASLRFASRFFTVLGQGKPVEEALAVARRVLGADYAIPALYTCVADSVVAAGPPAQRIRPSTYAAHHVSADWPEGGALATADHARARIDLLWGLDRGAVTGVLADAPGADLGADLNALEAAVEPALAELGLPRRRWFTIDPQRSAPPEDHDQLAGRSTGNEAWSSDLMTGDGHAFGLVVRLAVPREGWHFRGGQAAELAAYTKVRSRLFPLGGLLFQIISESPVDALLAAADLGRELPGEARPDVLARVSAAGRRIAGAVSGVPGDMVAALRERIALAKAARAVGVAPPRTSDLVWDPQLVAVRVVESLNSRAEELSDEALFLRELRLWQPEYFRPVLLRMAAARRGPGRYASLAVAADFDDDLHAWTSSGDGVEGLDPAQGRHAWLTAATVEAIAWGLPAGQAAVWRSAMTEDAAAAAAGRPGRAQAVEVAARCSPATIGQLVRQNIVTDHDLEAIGSHQLAFWALLTHTPVSAELVRRLGKLTPAERGLLGLRHPQEERHDMYAAELGEAVRRVLHPVVHLG